MKEHNYIVKFKNSFIPEQEKHQKLQKILKEDSKIIVSDKLKGVVELYRRNVAENGYNPLLAFRVITLCLFSHYQTDINLTDEINRFFKNCVLEGSLQNLRICFDLLLLKQVTDVVPQQEHRLLKIKMLKALSDYYKKVGSRNDRKKCSYTLQEYCKQALKQQIVKRKNQIYSQILDILIEEFKQKISRLCARSNKIVAVEQLTAFTLILQTSQLIVSKKYQIELLNAYWSLAMLHDQLHYLAYTRKYVNIAINIAQRTEQQNAVIQLRNFLQRLG